MVTTLVSRYVKRRFACSNHISQCALLDKTNMKTRLEAPRLQRKTRAQSTGLFYYNRDRAKGEWGPHFACDKETGVQIERPNSHVHLLTARGHNRSQTSIPVRSGVLLMSGIAPSVDGREQDESGRKVFYERHLAAHLRHHKLRVEQVAEKTLLIRRRKIFDLPAYVRRYLLAHRGSISRR
jgi:hypothetical protein